VRRRPTRAVVVIVVVFVVSRLVAFAFGLRFDDGLLHGAYQLLDVRLLRDDPVRSIVYLQSQPPLFNVVTAFVVRLPHSFVNTTLMLVWHAASLVTALLLFSTAVRLGVRAGLATAVVCVFLLLPETMLVESWYFYSQLEMLLVASMLWGLARFASQRRLSDGIVFTGSLGALVLMRSSWHVLFMVVLVTVVAVQLRLDARKVAAVAAVPLVVVAAWSVKNAVLFGSWSSSSWLGMNLSYVAHAGVTDHQCRQLQERHRLSAFACRRAFARPSAYAGHVPRPEHFGVPAVDAWHKSTGQPNFNAALYAEVSDRYQRDSITLLRAGGVAALARAEAAAYTVWAEPGDDLLQLRRAREPISGYADWFDRIVLLRPVARGRTDPARFAADAGAFPVGDALGSISYALLVVFGLAIYGGVSGWRRGRRSRRPAQQCVCAVGLIVIAYSLIVGNALDFRENNRFRVETAPAVVVLGLVGAEHLWQATRRGKGRRRTPRPSVRGGSGVPG
jgi:hypothetical protein